MSSPLAKGAAADFEPALDEASARRIEAIRHVSAVVAEHADALVEEIERRVAQLRAERAITPVEPREIAANPFQLFGVQGKETYWTKWLASMLAPGTNERLSLLVWEALTATIAAAAQRNPPAGANLLSAQEWKAASSAPLRHVEAEWIDENYRPDLLVETDGMVIVVEIKLGAPWSDGDEKFGQAKAYATAGRRRLREHEGAKLGLVLLTKNPKMKHPDDWIRITWVELARELRAGLKKRLDPHSSPGEVLELAPALYLVQVSEPEMRGDPFETMKGLGPGPRLLAAVRHLESFGESE